MLMLRCFALLCVAAVSKCLLVGSPQIKGGGIVCWCNHKQISVILKNSVFYSCRPISSITLRYVLSWPRLPWPAPMSVYPKDRFARNWVILSIIWWNRYFSHIKLTTKFRAAKNKMNHLNDMGMGSISISSMTKAGGIRTNQDVRLIKMASVSTKRPLVHSGFR